MGGIFSGIFDAGGYPFFFDTKKYAGKRQTSVYEKHRGEKN